MCFVICRLLKCILRAFKNGCKMAKIKLRYLSSEKSKNLGVQNNGWRSISQMYITTIKVQNTDRWV